MGQSTQSLPKEQGPWALGDSLENFCKVIRADSHENVNRIGIMLIITPFRFTHWPISETDARASMENRTRPYHYRPVMLSVL